MNKKFKFFLKIVYFVFTFGLGFLIAITLPSQYKYIEIAEEINRNITDQEFTKAIDTVASVYDKNHVFHYKKDEKTGVIIYKTLTIIDQTGVEGATQTNIAQSAYAGFMYGVDDYDCNTSGDEVNLTELVVNGQESIKLINYDFDENGKDDSIITMVNKNYVYFELSKNQLLKLNEINSLKFLDKRGKTYLEVTDDLSLNFNDQFFTEIENFIYVYNNDVNDENKNKKLTQLLTDFLELDNNYKQGGDYYETAVKIASRKSVIFVAVYFLTIYFFYDCTLGRRFVIGIFVKLYRKIKYKGKEIPKKETEEVYGKDYYTQLTYRLIVPEDDDITATIKYHNENDSLEMVFSKDKNYTVVKRIHAGKYQNAWLECEGYEAINIPKILQVRGYKMLVEVTLQRKKTD